MNLATLTQAAKTEIGTLSSATQRELSGLLTDVSRTVEAPAMLAAIRAAWPVIFGASILGAIIGALAVVIL